MKNNNLNISALQTWYEVNQRDLPFRKTKDPYAIWVSEVMLQQTKIETVIPYYKRFIETYPNVYALALTTQEDLLKLLEGIGYYRRFKNMLLAAKKIVDEYQGVFPDNINDVKSLPGVGLYTAGAIMSIAYNQPYAATDGNVIRVLSRIYNLSENMRLDKHKKNVHQLNQSLIDNAIPHIYTQAIMELGALLCLPRNPKCKICPVKENCFAFMLNKQDTLPFIEKQSKKKEHNYICLVIRQGKHIILQKRNQPLLEGMYEYPQFKSKSFNQVQKDLKKSDVQISLIKKGLVYKHIFTHQIWTMQVYYVSLLEGLLEHWIPVEKIDIYNYPMAIAHRKIDNCNF